MPQFHHSRLGYVATDEELEEWYIEDLGSLYLPIVKRSGFHYRFYLHKQKAIIQGEQVKMVSIVNQRIVNRFGLIKLEEICLDLIEVDLR